MLHGGRRSIGSLRGSPQSALGRNVCRPIPLLGEPRLLHLHLQWHDENVNLNSATKDAVGPEYFVRRTCLRSAREATVDLPSWSIERYGLLAISGPRERGSSSSMVQALL